jgi:hypothetical protein
MTNDLRAWRNEAVRLSADHVTMLSKQRRSITKETLGFPGGNAAGPHGMTT